MPSCKSCTENSPSSDLIATPAIPPKLTAKPSHSMGRARSIGKPSKVSANISKGKLREQRESLQFHQEGIPILVDSQLLRMRGMGQCDLVRFLPRENLIDILEVKSRFRPSPNQWARLKASANFLAAIFNKTPRLRSICELQTTPNSINLKV